MENQYSERHSFLRKSSARNYEYETPNVYLDIIYGYHTGRNIKGFSFAQPIHLHPHYEMHLILEGECRFATESKEVLELSEGNAIIFSPKTKHKIISESECFRKITLSFKMDVKDNKNTDFYSVVEKKLVTPKVYKTNEQIKNHTETLVLNAKKKQYIYSNIMHLAAVSIIFELFRIVVGNDKIKTSKKSNDIRVTKAIEYIENNISSNLDVEEVANHLHISVKQFGRIFKNEMNITPGAYIKNFRIQCIHEMLINNLNIEDIAGIMGYSDTTSLIKAYKRITGTTPSKHQKSMKET